MLCSQKERVLRELGKGEGEKKEGKKTLCLHGPGSNFCVEGAQKGIFFRPTGSFI